MANCVYIFGARATQALRCRDPSLGWCLEDGNRWEEAARLTREGERLAYEGNHGKAVELFTKVARWGGYSSGVR